MSGRGKANSHWWFYDARIYIKGTCTWPEHLAQMCRRGKANTINSHWWFYDAIHKMQVVGGGSFLMVLIG